jgi:hypothetical protein
MDILFTFDFFPNILTHLLKTNISKVKPLKTQVANKYLNDLVKYESFDGNFNHKTKSDFVQDIIFVCTTFSAN